VQAGCSHPARNSLTAVLDAVSARFPSSPPSSSSPSAPSDAAAPPADPPTPTSTPTIYLAMIEKDASIVYYVLRQGIVSPKEVPE